jgi:threonylcarbamoyladenosine tRNA methylthiotransferase MtaB
MDGRRVAIATLGCRLNQVDSQELQAALERRGFRAVGVDEAADVVVVNTCTVTARADVSDRRAIHRAVRRHPGARVVVTGCWAQTAPAAVARVRGVDLVVGNADKPRLAELVERLLADTAGLPRPGRQVSDVAALTTLPPAPFAGPGGRARAFVKVQDGCQHRCAFCIVPLARGPSRSRPPAAVLEHVRELVEAGHGEVTLTGVDLGHYGRDLRPPTTLASLLRAMVETPGLGWVRLSSVLAAYFTPELIDVITGSLRVAPHLHIPLQSGSERVLRRMRRPYTAAMYRRLVERLTERRSGLGLGTDVIVGFPGERDPDFAETRALVEALPFSYLHVFTYSDRPGTEAVALDGHLDPRLVSARSQELRELGLRRGLAFRRGLVGTQQEVVVLETRERRTGALIGLTGNYVEVAADGPDALRRRIVPLRITEADEAGTRGVFL